MRISGWRLARQSPPPGRFARLGERLRPADPDIAQRTFVELFQHPALMPPRRDSANPAEPPLARHPAWPRAKRQIRQNGEIELNTRRHQNAPVRVLPQYGRRSFRDPALMLRSTTKRPSLPRQLTERIFD